ncbi:MAG: hypothetical protein ACM3UR_04155, partial [Bacteroidota bacterium]
MNCKANKTLLIAAAIIVLFSSKAFPQFSFYGNTSFGYYNNPLYNYQRKPDQLRQSYLEMNYLKDFEASRLSFSYVSGLMLFNQLSDRNFYEHNIFAKYNLRLTKKPSAGLEKGAAPMDEEASEGDDSTSTESEEIEPAEEEESAESVTEDSSASYLN